MNRRISSPTFEVNDVILKAEEHFAKVRTAYTAAEMTTLL